MEILQKSHTSVGQKALEAHQSAFLIAGYCGSLPVKVPLFPKTFQQWRKAFFFFFCIVSLTRKSCPVQVTLTSLQDFSYFGYFTFFFAAALLSDRGSRLFLRLSEQRLSTRDGLKCRRSGGTEAVESRRSEARAQARLLHVAAATHPSGPSPPGLN